MSNNDDFFSGDGRGKPTDADGAEKGVVLMYEGGLCPTHTKMWLIGNHSRFSVGALLINKSIPKECQQSLTSLHFWLMLSLDNLLSIV